MNRQLGRMLSQRLRDKGMETVLLDLDRDSIVKGAESFRPDAVIIGRRMSDDALLETVRQCRSKVNKTFFIIFSDRKCPVLEKKLGSSGCLLTYPVDPYRICQLIFDSYAGRRKSETPAEQENVRALAEKMLCDMGIAANLRGTNFLVRAVAMAVKDRELTYELETIVYPVIAGRCGVRVSSARKAVSQTLRLACDRGGAAFMRDAFGGRVPDDSRFIRYASEIGRAHV